ncbi:ATP-binding cassette domain-containing protein [Planktomarina temperata]|nr:ATP-binding cassette domain-containing protein [Planktomarina temperata]
MPVIEIKSLHKAYGDLEVLKGVDITAKRGDVVALIGSSGSGKSTLLRCCNMLEISQKGAILFQGEAVRWSSQGHNRRPADAYGLSGWSRFRRVIWPTSLRLAWPAYTNEAIFLFHATTLVFFSGFPAWQQRGDALYYASYFADKTFNPFIAYPISAFYFILLTFVIIGFFGLVNARLNRHLPSQARPKLRYRPQVIR